MRRDSNTVLFVLALGLMGVVAAPHEAGAQAWVPGARWLSTSLGYQYLESDQHLFSVEDPATGSNELDLGAIKSQLVSMSFDYGVTNRLAISGGVAFISSEYNGQDPDNPVIDNGSWNSDFQDLALSVRYNALVAPVALTPSISFGMPTNNYETLGHAAVGGHLSSLGLGLSAGWSPRRWLEGAFVHANYTYSFVEDVEGISLNRSNASGQVGYYILPSLSAGAFIGYAHVHGGVDWAHDLTEHNFHSHDRGAATESTSVGGGLSYVFTRRSTLSLSYSTILAGVSSNTHNAHGFMLTNTWNFSGL